MNDLEMRCIQTDIQDLKKAWMLLVIAVVSMNNNLSFHLGERAKDLYQTKIPEDSRDETGARSTTEFSS